MGYAVFNKGHTVQLKEKNKAGNKAKGDKGKVMRDRPMAHVPG